MASAGGLCVLGGRGGGGGGGGGVKEKCEQLSDICTSVENE